MEIQTFSNHLTRGFQKLAIGPCEGHHSRGLSRPTWELSVPPWMSRMPSREPGREPELTSVPGWVAFDH